MFLLSLCLFSTIKAPPLHRSEGTQPHSALLSEWDTVHHLKGSACCCDTDPRAGEIKEFYTKKERKKEFFLWRKTTRVTELVESRGWQKRIRSILTSPIMASWASFTHQMESPVWKGELITGTVQERLTCLCWMPLESDVGKWKKRVKAGEKSGKRQSRDLNSPICEMWTNELQGTRGRGVPRLSVK